MNSFLTMADTTRIKNWPLLLHHPVYSSFSTLLPYSVRNNARHYSSEYNRIQIVTLIRRYSCVCSSAQFGPDEGPPGHETRPGGAARTVPRWHGAHQRDVRVLESGTSVGGDARPEVAQQHSALRHQSTIRCVTGYIRRLSGAVPKPSNGLDRTESNTVAGEWSCPPSSICWRDLECLEQYLHSPHMSRGRGA